MDADICMMELTRTPNCVDVAANTLGGEPLPMLAPQDEDIDLHAGELSTIAGWGDTTDSEYTQSFPTILQVVEVPVLSEAECEADISASQITTGMICAAVPEGGLDACQGDSGGPM